MAKKKENVLEKAEKAVEKVAKEVAHTVEKALEAAEEKVEELIDGEEKKKPHKKEDSHEKNEKLEALKKKLKEKAKALEGKVDEGEKITLKEKVTGEKEEKKDMLVPIEDYLKSSIHLGTRVITPDMRPFVYKRRADGLAVFNTSLLDDALRKAIDYLSQFAPEDMLLVCKREAGWKAVQLMAKTLGIQSYTKKYPAGILTNTNLDTFIETKLMVIFDPWLDKNALSDARRVNIPVFSMCDTNNFARGINFVLPGNNKSWKSIGMICYLLTKGYAEKRKMSVTIPSVQEFVEGWDTLQPPA
jgi:small subunit ribosomal protein S2